MSTECEEPGTEADFIAWVDEIRRGAAGEMPFVWAIMRSRWIRLHWSLISDETLDAGFRRSLRSRFSEHGEDGRDFLLGAVAAGEASGEAILVLAKMCDPLVNGIAGRADVRALAVQLLADRQDAVRSSSILALGWIGDAADISILIERIRTDVSSDCRVAAAGALVQLLTRHPGNDHRDAVESALCDALEQDPDPLVREAAAEALGELIDSPGVQA